jgi:hypothetical protein
MEEANEEERRCAALPCPALPSQPTNIFFFYHPTTIAIAIAITTATNKGMALNLF